MITQTVRMHKGFTLVELLVVIVILAILSTVGVLIFREVTQKVTDARKQTDIAAIAKAYEANYNPLSGYIALNSNQFVAGAIPISPDGGSYYNNLLPNGGFRVCSAINGGSNPCSVNSETCYCKDSVQITYVAPASPPPSSPPPPADTQAPSQPTNLQASAISQTRVDLSWTASTDNVGVTGYKVLRDSVVIATTATTAHSDTSVVASTTYSYQVLAFDAAGNESTPSTAANVTTPSPPTATIGLINPGSSDSPLVDLAVGSRVVMGAVNGTVTSMSVYVRAVAAAPNNKYRMAIYADSSGSPGAFIASTTAADLTPNVWNIASISAPPLTAGTPYWLFFNSNGSDTFTYNTTGGTCGYKALPFVNPWPNPLGTVTNCGGAFYSIYATYNY